MWRPGDHRLMSGIYDAITGPLGELFPKVFGRVHGTRRTPIYGLVAIGLVQVTIVREVAGRLLDDLRRYLILDFEDVPHRAVVSLRPQFAAVCGVDQLRDDAHAKVRFPPGTGAGMGMGEPSRGRVIYSIR